MRYLFAEFELNVPGFELRRDGHLVRLQRQVFDVLLYLVEHRDRVVDRTELLDALWPGVVVNESAVAWCVSHARKALGQRRSDKQPIETVHGRGYRFRGNVRELPLAATVERAPSSEPGPISSARDPMIGRDAVMARLQRALPSGGRHGGLVLLAGDPGIGKTRCALELSDAARELGWTVRTGRSVEDDMAPPLWPWIEVLRDRAAGKRDSAVDEECSELLAQLVPKLGSSGADAMPRDEFWLLDRLVRHLFRTAEAERTFIVLDDLQWADLPSLRVLSLLAPRLSLEPLFVIGTLRDPEAYRSEHAAKLLSGLSRYAERIHLSELGVADVEAYVQAVSRRPARADLCAEIHHRSGGNPLLMKETIRLLQDRRGPQWDRLALLSEVAVPEEGRDVLRGRLESLDADTAQLLRVASTVGQSFGLSIVERALDLPEERLLSALDQAVAQRFIVERPGLGEYAFTHDLVREVLYRDLPAAEKSKLHARIAQAWEARSLGTADYAQVALHYYRALPLGNRAKLVRFASTAGRIAMRLFAHEDAARLFSWALDAQSFIENPDPAETAELCLNVARACGRLGRSDEARRHLARAIDIAREHRLGALLVRAGTRLRVSLSWGRAPDPLAREALEEALKVLPPEERALRSRALAELAGIPPHSLDREKSRALSDQAVELAREEGGSAWLGAVRSRLFSRTGIDDVADLLATTGEILRLDALENPTWASVEARYARVSAYFLLGDLPAVARELAEFGKLARELHLLETEWNHRRLLSQLDYFRCDFERAKDTWTTLSLQSEQLGLRYGNMLEPLMFGLLAYERDAASPSASAGPFQLLWGWARSAPAHRMFGVRLMLDDGKVDDARRELEAISGPAFDAIPRDFNFLNGLANAALVALALDDRVRQRNLYELLLPYESANTANSLFCALGSVAHFLGLIADARGDRASAVSHLEIAVARNHEMGARHYELQSEIELARLLLGDPSTASRGRELLTRAGAGARELAIVPLLRRAESIERQPF